MHTYVHPSWTPFPPTPNHPPGHHGEWSWALCTRTVGAHSCSCCLLGGVRPFATKLSLQLALSSVWLFGTPWTVANRLLCPRDLPGKNTGVSCHFLLQGIFPTQGSNSSLLHFLHWPGDSSPLSCLRSPLAIYFIHGSISLPPSSSIF